MTDLEVMEPVHDVWLYSVKMDLISIVRWAGNLPSYVLLRSPRRHTVGLA
jgi:hypothetical protein